MTDTRVHEWPLVVFTTLAITGAGLLSTPLVAALVAGTPATAAPALPWGAGLLAAGLAVSLLHLGRPGRAPQVIRAIGRSRLSTEVALAGVALIAGIGAALLPYTSPLLDAATGVAALAFLLALGLVYSLPGQPTWRGAVVGMPLTMGLGFGVVTIAGMWDGAVAAVAPVAAAVLAADIILLLLRRLALAWPPASLSPRHPSVFAHRHALLAARLALVDILPGCFMIAGLPRIAALGLGVGVLADRVTFYGLAAPATTEADLASAEELLGT
jgi:DMSO reductase anchor subunit